jgi:hypothetical protein
MPTLGKLVQSIDDELDPLARDACGYKLLFPVGRQRLTATTCIPGVLKDVRQNLRPTTLRLSRATFPPLPVAHRTGYECLVDGMERARVATCGKLAEHRPVQLPLGLRYKMKQVVGEIVVVARSWIHDKLGRLRPLDKDAVATEPGLLEGDSHQTVILSAALIKRGL